MTKIKIDSEVIQALFREQCGIKAASPLEITPCVLLQRWSVHEISVSGQVERLLVGWNATEQSGRMSTPISEFSPSTRTCKTQSGRVYQLDGPLVRIQRDSMFGGL